MSEPAMNSREHKERCKGAKYYKEYYETRDYTGTSTAWGSAINSRCGAGSAEKRWMRYIYTHAEWIERPENR